MAGKDKDTKNTSWLKNPMGLINLVGAPSAIAAILGASMIILGLLFFLLIEDLRAYTLIIVITGIMLVVLALITSFAQVKTSVTGRRGRYTTITIATIASFVLIILLVNFLSFRISYSESPVRLDLTANKQLSLSDQTKKILSNLDEEILATAFYTPGEINIQNQAEDLLNEFRRRSQGKFSYRIVDPQKDRTLAKRYNISIDGVIIFEEPSSQRRTPVFTEINNMAIVTEQDFTSAILVVTGQKQKKIYFLVGHGEHDIYDISVDTTGYGSAARALIGDNYNFGTINLRETGSIPDDAAALVIAGPTKDLEEAQPAILNTPATPSEIDILYNWLLDGGNALFLLNPDTPKTFTDILSNWGVNVGTDTIVDQDSSVFGDLRTPLLNKGQYSNETLITRGQPPITEPLNVTFFPEATSLGIELALEKRPPWITYAPFAFTSRNSWLASDPEDNDRPNSQIAGFLPIGMAITGLSTQNTEPTKNSKLTTIVVLGDSDFANNRYFSAVTNGDLFLNSINWLTNRYELISIRSKPQVYRDLILTREEFSFIRYSSWFFLPIGVAILGLLSWWRRQLGP